ncbi:hypothetical protein SAY87_017198 [Trapa incisa]|uniref:Cupin type-1 domain-containing protein n=1 Tax=Trapa incisa TaxID=236973 RepID=A0AAN7L7B6_9MYRT|nr:hypothetical protein SAY87_017198 [Trapa incisa]
MTGTLPTSSALPTLIFIILKGTHLTTPECRNSLTMASFDESSLAVRGRLLGFLCLTLLYSYTVSGKSSAGLTVASVARKDERTVVADTEYGEISAVEVGYGRGGTYNLQFITLEPNSLFLPVLLHADMVLYVHTGSGRLTWVDEDDTKRVDIRCGDVYRLPPGTIFHIQSDLQPEREKLRIHAIFTNTEENYHESAIREYSRVGDILRGFDRRVLQQAFKVPAETIDEILNATRPPAIIHAGATSLPKKQVFWEWEARILKSYLVSGQNFDKNKKKRKTFNMFEADKDFENCNGWSVMVNKKDLRALKHADIGVFMVNLTKGSMMGPHWNPYATEVATVLHGQGMIRVVCASSSKESECKNVRVRLKEGDVFMVQRFHPMAQMSYNNDSFVFMGFSTTPRRNYPQFLAGRSSVLQALGREVLSASFNVPNTTVEKLMETQADSVILECTSCAEEEERLMEEEIERERKEEGEERRKQEEEEAEEGESKEEEQPGRSGRGEEEKRRRQREEEDWRIRRSEEAEREEEEAGRQEEEMERWQTKGEAGGGEESTPTEWEEEGGETEPEDEWEEEEDETEAEAEAEEEWDLQGRRVLRKMKKL